MQVLVWLCCWIVDIGVEMAKNEEVPVAREKVKEIDDFLTG